MRVVAGEALGIRAVIDTHTPVVYQDWSLKNGADVTVAIAAGHNAMVYVFEGSALIGDKGREINDGQLAVLGSGDAVRLRGTSDSGRLLLLAGVPHGEPVAHYGPFVMNTEQELVEAVRDFQSGKMGEITRSAEVG